MYYILLLFAVLLSCYIIIYAELLFDHKHIHMHAHLPVVCNICLYILASPFVYYILCTKANLVIAEQAGLNVISILLILQSATGKFRDLYKFVL